MRAFKIISKMDFGFLAVLSLIIVIASGMIKESVIGSIIMYLLLFVLLYIIYGIWYLIYKIGRYFWDKKLKVIFDEKAKCKEEIQNS